MSNLPGSNKEKAIKNFWLRHYRYGQHEVSDRKLKVMKYSTGHDQRDINFCVHATTLNAFTIASQRDIGRDF